MIAPLAHSAEVEFLPRAFHHAPLEPPDGVLHGAGQDPVAFRLAHLEDPRAHAVIEKALSAAPWWNDKSGDREGTGRGS